MHEFTTPKETKKEEKYENIILQIKHLVEDEKDIIGILSNISAAIANVKAESIPPDKPIRTPFRLLLEI